MKAFEIRYDLPGSSGHREIVLAENEETALVNLEKKDTDFKNISGYYKVHRIKELSLDAVKVGKLSVSELQLLFKSDSQTKLRDVYSRTYKVDPQETSFYGIAVFLHSLIAKDKVPKEELKPELIRIIDEMYDAFR